MNNSFVLPFESPPEAHTRRVYRRLGLLNGLLIGLALALGAWGVDAIRATQLPFPLALPTFFFSALSLMAVCGLIGWLTSRLAKTWLSTILWLLTSVGVALVIGYQPYHGRTWMVWLADRRFWGLNIYPYTAGGTVAGLILGSLFILLVLTVMGLMQHFRLEGVVRELDSNERLTGRVWFQLLLPLPIVALATLFTAGSIENPAVQGIGIIQEVIEVGRTFEGDDSELSQLGLERGVSYRAISGVRDQLTETYTLGIGDVNAETSTVIVAAHFDNGAWINCRVIAGQATFCDDASRPYTTGLVELMNGITVAEDCRNCQPEAGEQWQSWLRDHQAALGERPQVTRLAQWGSEVLMRVESATGDKAVECWFTGLQPVHLRSCEEVGGNR